MFKWQKMGLVFRPSEHRRPWMYEFAQAPCVIQHEDFIRVYFSTRPKPVGGWYESFSAYVDLVYEAGSFRTIGLADKPILDLGGLGCFDQRGIYPVSVIRHQSKYRCYYAGWSRCGSVPFNVQIGVAESDDGQVFHRIGPGPVLGFSADDPFILSGPKIRWFDDQFYLWYIAGHEWVMDGNSPEPVYRIKHAVSGDGFNWERTGVFDVQTVLPGEAQASPDVYKSDAAYHMFFCYRHIRDYRSKHGGYRIGYARSTDLISWNRDDQLAGIDVSEHGWDSEMISYPHLFNLNGEVFMFYLGNSVGREGFGVAKLLNPELLD